MRVIGRELAQYRIEAKIGAGGMGVVYRARDLRLEREVAIKVLSAALIGDEAARARFRKEALTLARLNHPNVGTVFDFNSEQGVDFLVMELVEGQPLSAKLESGPLPERELTALGLQVVAALQEAHERGIIHRDLKPGNILVTPKGQVKVLDFGLARLLKAGGEGDVTMSRSDPNVLAGTVPYMSPEQLRGRPADARSDIWALGVVLYEMATGQRPFEGRTGFEVSSAILQRGPRVLPPAVSGTLRAVIERCLEKDAERRYQRALEVRAALEGTHGQVAAAAASEKSIAVLYFENMSPDKESDYFCAGITDDIIITLSKIKGLRVAPRSDVQPYRNKEVNRRQLGEALRVDYVLEGGVRKAGNKVRITAQLVGAQDGVQVWADRFDFPVDDIFEVQDEVARKIADALKLSLSEAEKRSLARKPTDDLRAYDHYLRGKELLYQRGRKNNESAMRLFEEAAGIDSQFAGAYAGLAEAYAGMFEWYDGRSSWLGRAIEMNEKALELDPSSLDARFGIALVYFYQKRWSESQRALEEILKEDEGYQPAHLRLGMIAEFAGDMEAARRRFLRAAELKPNDEDAWRFLTGVYRKQGDQAAAHEASLRVIEIASKKLEASPDDVTVMSRLAEAYARYGGREETHATLRRVMELDPNDGLALYNCACAYALLGEKQDTLLLLRRAFDSGFRAVVHWVRADSAFDALRGDPEFAQRLAELA